MFDSLVVVVYESLHNLLVAPLNSEFKQLQLIVLYDFLLTPPAHTDIKVIEVDASAVLLYDPVLDLGYPGGHQDLFNGELDSCDVGRRKLADQIDLWGGFFGSDEDWDIVVLGRRRFVLLL